MKIVAIAIGGSLGALARYWISAIVNTAAGGSFPYGTLSVNCLGSFIIGLLFIVFQRTESVPPEVSAGITVGLLGALTTFSTFSLDTFRLIENTGMITALVNIALNVVLCMLGVWLGIAIGRWL